MVWFIVLTYGAVVLAAFWIANSEGTKASAAQKTAKDALAAAEAASKQIETASKSIGEGIASIQDKLRESQTSSDNSYKYLIDLLLKKDESDRKIKEKLDWLEMKVNNLPKASPSPTKVILSQDKPIQFTVITRQGPPLRRKPTPPPVDPKVMDNIKKKIQELSP